MFCTPCLAVFPTHVSQLDLNPANLEAAVQAEWIMAFLFLPKWHKSMTLQSRHHYIAPYKSWWDILQFSVTRIVRMIRAKKKYEKLSKFVKVTAKILSVPYFRTYHMSQKRLYAMMSMCLSVHLFGCSFVRLSPVKIVNCLQFFVSSTRCDVCMLIYSNVAAPGGKRGVIVSSPTHLL